MRPPSLKKLVRPVIWYQLLKCKFGSGQALEKQMSHNVPESNLCSFYIIITNDMSVHCDESFYWRHSKNGGLLVCGLLPISRLKSSPMEFLSIPRPSHFHPVLRSSPCIVSALLSPFLWLPLDSLCSVSCPPIQYLREDHSLL